ncbi:MAG: ribulose-phosphate 3-epimerase [Oligoflexales bacterium]|nr:ribulose-phosphate 3-epimerase [Oligoflexales bacterium]
MKRIIKKIRTKSSILVAPSLLSADPLNLFDEIKEMESFDADFHHIDVMDGHFVPNLTFGVHFIRPIKKIAEIPLDVHIMVSNPDIVALEYIREGADIVTFHVEASSHPHNLLKRIRDEGGLAGIAINPGTYLGTLEPLLEYVDLVNIMSVNPGFSGQSFITGSVNRVSKLLSMLKLIGREKDVLIEIDGGINSDTAKLVVEAGANVLVTGSYVFNSKDRKARIEYLKGIK